MISSIAQKCAANRPLTASDQLLEWLSISNHHWIIQCTNGLIAIDSHKIHLHFDLFKYATQLNWLLCSICIFLCLILYYFDMVYCIKFKLVVQNNTYEKKNQLLIRFDNIDRDIENNQI